MLVRFTRRYSVVLTVTGRLESAMAIEPLI